jgi:ElaB/YqjD/DUF883 family membrane-anchored ribosome-binding protein
VDHELEVIRGQMEETRASLADKIEALESQVRETVQSASDTVTSAVDGAKEVVSSVTEGAKEVVEKVTETVDTVKESLNVSRYVERYPWASMGVAVATGFVAAQLVPTFGSVARRVSGAVYPVSTPATPSQAPTAYQPQTRQEGGGWTESLTGMVKPAIGTLEGLAVGTLMSAIKSFVNRNLPQQWHGELTRVIDDVTTRLGGKVMQGNPLDELLGSFKPKQDNQHAATSPQS